MNPNEYVILQKDRQYLSLWNGFVPSRDVITVAGLEYIEEKQDVFRPLDLVAQKKNQHIAC